MYPRAFLLVVTKYHYGIQYIDSGMTMTDLKQEGCSPESRVKKLPCQIKKTRMSALYKELYKVITKPINAGDKIRLNILFASVGKHTTIKLVMAELIMVMTNMKKEPCMVKLLDLL